MTYIFSLFAKCYKNKKKTRYFFFTFWEGGGQDGKWYHSVIYLEPFPNRLEDMAIESFSQKNAQKYWFNK